MTEHLLAQSLLLILASALAVGFFAASRMPAAMGYLLAGLSIGPYGLNLVALGDDTRFLAELGLIFLMFMVGLEFSLATLLAARTDVLLAGSLQVAATLATIAAALWWLGLDLRLAILLGGAAAMSSTAVVPGRGAGSSGGARGLPDGAGAHHLDHHDDGVGRRAGGRADGTARLQ